MRRVDVQESAVFTRNRTMSHSDLSGLSVLRTEPIVRGRKRVVSTFFEELYLVADLSEVTIAREKDASSNHVTSLGVKRSRTSNDLSSFFESNMSETDSETSLTSKEEDSDSSVTEGEEEEEEENEVEDDDVEKNDTDQYGRCNKRQCLRENVAAEGDCDGALFF